MAEVETSLLKTKLNIPLIRPQLVSRSRLNERLNEGLDYNLILVSAPAGFGKTTLLSEWVHQKTPEIKFPWFSIDKGDNDPVRFWNYFIAALQTMQPACGENILPLLHSSQPLSTEPMLNVLINDLSNIPSDFVVVLDDYHLIESRQIHDGITYLVEHMPVQMHLVIAARADPPLPLASYRGKGTMLAIGTDDLRFTLDDATSLLTELKTPELSSGDVTALNERTEGWAVGLKMAALSISEQEDIPGFIADFTGSQRYIMDYLMEEVLQKQTEEIRGFLLQTSILEMLSGPLCDTVIEQKGSRDILLNLERGHLFIVPLDKSRQWYRYEHLFADILRHQLEDTYTREDIAGLHRRASRWYEDNGLPDDAINHALAARDWEKATALIIELGDKKNLNGEFITLNSWLQRLPEDVLQTHSQLDLLYCRALIINTQLDAADYKLQALEKAAQSDDSLMSDIATLRVHLAHRRGDPDVEELATKALSLLPLDKSDARCVIFNILGWRKFHRGNLKEAESLLTVAYDTARQAGNNYFALLAVGALGVNVWYGGKMRRAYEMYKQAIELVGDSPAAVMPYYLLSMIHLEWNELETADYYVQHAIELGQLVGTTDIITPLYDALAKIRFYRHDETGALKALEHADLVFHATITPYIRAGHIASRIIGAVRRDDLTSAQEWYDRLAEYADASYLHERWIPLRLLVAQGKKREAAEELGIIYEQAVQGNVIVHRVLWRVQQALAAETEEAAVEFLADALTMAEPEGYIRTFVDEGKILKPLLQKALTEGITPEYTGKLLNIIEAEERMRKKARGGEIPLSERELEILRLLAADVSNQQIAEMLTISLSTVKTHVHHILEKLDAKDRSQAVFYARELELM